MAFEQNPYAVKVTLVADSTLQPATTSPLPSTEKQFRFVKIAGSFTVASITTVVGSSTLSGFTATNAGYAGIVPGSAISGTGIPAGSYIVSTNIGAGTLTISNAATAAGTVTVTITSSSHQSGGPVASAITGTTGTATSTRLFGIIQNAPLYKNAASGTVEAFAEAEITVSGISKVQAGATIAAGDPITADGYGNAMTATFATTGTTNAPASTQYVYGTALTGGVVGDIIAVAISCASAVRAG